LPLSEINTACGALVNFFGIPNFLFLQYDEGIEFAKLALEAGDEHPAASRVHVALGIGHSLKAAEMKLKADRQALHNKALRAFQKCVCILSK
jgi:hypothetical protein